MSRRNDNPVIKVVPHPGKVSTHIYSVGLSKSKPASNEVKVTNKVSVIKASGQKIKESFSVRYRLPYVDPEFVKICYESNPEHTRCLKFKSNCIIGLGLNVEPVVKSDADYTSDPEYIRLKEFTENPVNENNEDLIEVLRAWVEDYVDFGYGLLELVKNRNNELAELYYFPSYESRLVYAETKTLQKMIDKVSVLQLLSSSEAAVFPLFSESNWNDRAKERCVLLLRSINPFDRFYGFPDWYPATGKLALSKFIDEYNTKLFKNDLMISFVVIIEGGDLGEGQDASIKDFLQANYKGVQNANRALVLASDSPDVKIRIEKIQKDGREASFVLTQNAANDSIIISHGVVGSLLGISKAGKLGNTTENRDLFQVMNETVIKPEQRKIANKINNLIRVGLGIKKFKLVPVELTFEKLSEMVDFAVRTVDSGLLEETEGRAYLGYEPKKNPATLDEQIDNLNKSVKLLKSRLERV